MSLRYFSMSDFACKGVDCCGGANLIDADFVRELDDLRHELGFPIIVNSGYRCPKHNARTSTTGLTGPHTKSAADIKVRGDQAYRVVAAATRRGFTGIGVQQNGNVRFIHLDRMPNTASSPRPRIWSY